MLKKGLLALFLVFLTVLSGRAAVVEWIAAVVNGRVITLSDIEDETAIRRQIGESGDREQVLNSLIEREIVSKEAGRLGITVSMEEVARGILGFEDRFPSKEEFDSFLKGYELNMNDLSVRFSLSIAVSKVRQQKDAISAGRYDKWLDEVKKKADIKILK